MKDNRIASPRGVDPIVSIIICTRNRVGYLAAAIESIEAQEVSKEFHEIIIVDNASSDATREFVCSRASRDSNLRYVREPTIGLSSARNTGIRAARGEYLAFIDDDAIAEPGWLTGIFLAIDAHGPEAGCMSGKISPIWDAPRPLWLHDELCAFVDVLDYSAVPVWLTDHQDPFGGNVVYKKEALLRVGGFSTELGKKGNSLLSNEEILLHRQLKRLGYRTYYDPRIAIRHHVFAEQLTKSWFRRRAYWQGVSDAILERQFESWTLTKMAVRGLGRLGSLAKRPRELLVLAERGNEPAAFLKAFHIFRKLGYGLAGLHLYSACVRLFRG
jgi:glycosyltransferase involved in cell wall biosynthesis